MGGVFFIALLFYIVAGLMHVVGVFCFDKVSQIIVEQK